MGDADGGDLQVHRADAQPLACERLKGGRGIVIERQDVEVHQHFETVLKLGVTMDLLPAGCAAIARLRSYFESKAVYIALSTIVPCHCII